MRFHRNKTSIAVLGLSAVAAAGVTIAAVSPAAAGDGRPTPEDYQEIRAEQRATLLDVLNVSDEILDTARASGESIADLARSQGVEVDDVVDALFENRADRIAEKVADGTLTQEQADQRLERAAQRIANRVEGNYPNGARWRG